MIRVIDNSKAEADFNLKILVTYQVKISLYDWDFI
jgi:hypothetical protein